MADLTTLTTVKSYAGITDSAQDTKLSALLTAASDAIENYCDRTFATTSAVEYYDGRDNWRNGFLHLQRAPVTAITRIATEPLHVMTVANSAAAVQIATVAVATTGITLVSIASAVTTTTTLLFATYPTLTAMAAAVGAVSGWTAIVASGYDNWPSAYLRIPQGALNAKSGLTTAAPLYTYIREISDCRVNYDEGTIFGYFPVGRGNYETEVRYTAGYAEVPGAVQTACCIVVKAMNDASKIDANLAYEKLGDYSWGRRADQLIDLNNAMFADAIPLLAKYKRIRAL